MATVLRGLGASSGVALGRALRLDEPAAGSGGAPDAEAAVAALARVAAELDAAAERLRNTGLDAEAEILEANSLMAADPALEAVVRGLAEQRPPAEAVLAAAEGHAALLAALPDPLLAARAADVREIGRRAARLLGGQSDRPRPTGDAVLVARDLGPGEVAELQLGAGGVVAIALAAGAATSHAAIMARSLGVPMVVALGEELLAVGDGTLLALDGGSGIATLDPDADEVGAARAAVRRRAAEQQGLAELRGLPAATADGRTVTLLCNAATPAEVAAGLAGGADGVGLLRTELSFLEADSWPDEAAHRAALAPALALLAGRTATVRTLDFGADKTPPFLAGTEARGLALTLAHSDALGAQLRAIVAAGAGTRLRVLLPLVSSASEVRAVRALLRPVRGASAVAVGAMIETPEAARRAGEIALEADFLSIGTNDLVATTLGLDRDLPLASAFSAAEPEVLGHVARVVAAAHEAGIAVEVCGEAAGEPELVPLLVGLGVDELSVAPARLDVVRATVRGLRASAAEELAREALAAPSGRAVLELVRSGQGGHERDEALDGLGGVRA